ncbi:MAG: BamA/TamA family outer membrane protein, partial [Calditrichaeota bacterium]|nr:BamA/TamA family outer membrane protein [Calditrichota bacterium]
YTRVDSLVYEIAPDSSAAFIGVYIHESEKVRSGEIQLSGVGEAQAMEIKSRFYTRKGKEFKQSKFEGDMDDALTQFEKKGYPFSRFDLQAVTLDSSLKTTAFGIKLKTIQGPRLIINEVLIVGNKLTKKNVILRELRIKPGEVYDQRKVGQIQARLMRLGYFTRVDEPQVFLSSQNKGGLLIRLEEGNASKFDGVVGYNPATATAKGYFTGLINISIGNLLGTGRSLLVHWQKRDRKTQDMKFHYREPWVGGFPVSIGFGFQQLIQDTTYIQRDMGLDISMPLMESFSIVSEISRTEITPDSLGSFMFLIPHSRSLNASIGIHYDTRDDLLNPQSGVYYQTSIQAGRKKILGPETLVRSLQLKDRVDNKRLSLDVEYYSSIFKHQVLALALHGRQIRSNEKIIPMSDLYRLGGARTLRGYREDQFRGSSVGWLNLEYRYILGRRSRVSLFTDAGYYSATTHSGKNEAYKIGYGFGFRLETGLGIMGIDYGLGQGDGLFSGKVHVGLVNEF